MKAWMMLVSMLLALAQAGRAADDFIVVEAVSASPQVATQAASEAPAQTDNGWTWKRLSYGPIEIGAAALMPIMGIFVGGTIGAIVPIKGMHPYCKVLVPYTAVGGGAVGATAGAMLTPIILVEGVFDTFTGGAFAERPFAWFNVKVPLDGEFDMSAIENAALQQAAQDTQQAAP